MKLLLYGPPGAGKDTQGHILAQHFGASFVSTGRLLRAEMRTNTEIGQAIVPYVQSGEPVPSGIVHRIMHRALSRDDAQRGYVMNGYPRSLDTAETYLRLDQPSAVVVLEVNDETACLRLQLRARFDDVPGAIHKRLHAHKTNTPAILARLTETGVPVYHVDGGRTVSQVTDAIIAALAGKPVRPPRHFPFGR